MKILILIPLLLITLLTMNSTHSADIVPQKKITLGFIMGKFEPKTHPAFTVVDSKYADRNGLYMQAEAYAKFKDMYNAALQDGVKLKIRSATRNFNYQKGIWERKWTGQTKVGGKNLAKSIADPAKRAKKILRYSSMPGSSRHHWGTDIDLNSFENSWFTSGKGLKLYQWLQGNAAKFGFCQVYTPKDMRTGYEEEKWHWSYIPLASKYTKFAQRNLQAEQFAGFKGAKVAKSVDIVGKYVLGISRNCH